MLVKEAQIGSNDLEIHLRLKKLNYYSAIESVGIKIGNDSLQIKDNGNYILNGGPDTSPSTYGNIATLGGQTLSYSSNGWGATTYKVELPTVGTENHHIEIDIWGVVGYMNMSVRIHGHEDVFSGSNGLCGAWSGAVNGFYDRDLVLMPLAPPIGYFSFFEATAYGNEWRVNQDPSDPDSQILQGTLPAASWDQDYCVPQVRRKLILREARRKLEQCTPCLELESAGASQVQIDWCNYDANAIDCDFVEDAPMYNQSNPVYSKLYSPECASCGGGEIIHHLRMADFSIHCFH